MLLPFSSDSILPEGLLHESLHAIAPCEMEQQFVSSALLPEGTLEETA